ncbi:MAG: D-aminoacyl-tRNA deacylase [Tepidiformaceae bacterium]
MRAVVQRVLRARVTVEGREIAAIGRGFLVLLGVAGEDTGETASRMADKVAGLRIFEDDTGRMNLALADVAGEVLAVSQFTLYGDLRRGRRPSFTAAAPGPVAQPHYEAFCAAIEAAGITCARGAFGERMQVDLTNDGPVTLILDSRDLDAPRRA